MPYKLQLLNPASGKVERLWVVKLPAVVGRDPSVDVPIGDASISRRHCEFFLNAEEALSVRDFDSLNGTYVDDRKVNKRATVDPNGLVRIGSVCLKIEATQDPVTPNLSFGRANVDTTQPMQVISLDDPDEFSLDDPED